MNSFGGLGTGMHNLWQITNAQTRSICAENKKGKKGGGARAEATELNGYARELGKGWKTSPYIDIKKGETSVLAEINESGAINHIWMTPTGKWRDCILRFYWDGSTVPSIECPVGDFFASAENVYNQINSLAVCVNPGSAFNCYWEMPFKCSCKITFENRSMDDMVLFYQIDYTLCEIPQNAGYFHAEFRCEYPTEFKKEYIITDSIEGKGQYVGTYMYWQTNSNNWWGEGEIKFFMDGDAEYPTICGTGTEDYFCGSYDFMNRIEKKYEYFSSPYTGFIPVLPDGAYKSQTRFGMYRWHTCDPIRFEKNLRVTIQALGWRSGGRYLPLRDNISSVCFWYQDTPCTKRVTLPSANECELI